MPYRTALSWIAVVLLVGAARSDDTDLADPYRKFRSDSDRGELRFDDSHLPKFADELAGVPPLPAADELTAVPLDTLPAGLVAYLHLPTLAVTDEHRVTRYWLVVTGEGGGYNASYEGLRCNSGEYRVYAYGFRDRPGDLKPMPKSTWQNALTPAYRAELVRDILCAGITPKTPEQVQASIRGIYDYENPYSEYIHMD